MTDMLDRTVLDTAARIRAGVDSILAGKPESIRMALTVLLAGGHLLIEDVPGVGKTMLAKSLARTLGVTVRRMQFTPDLLPSDVTGRLGVQPGDPGLRVPTRARSSPTSCWPTRSTGPPPRPSPPCSRRWRSTRSPSTGRTHVLATPFLVIATQNPVDMEGTYALPEAQRDRFMARISLGYPSPADELRMLAEHAGDDPLLRPGSRGHASRSSPP